MHKLELQSHLFNCVALDVQNTYVNPCEYRQTTQTSLRLTLQRDDCVQKVVLIQAHVLIIIFLVFGIAIICLAITALHGLGKRLHI